MYKTRLLDGTSYWTLFILTSHFQCFIFITELICSIVIILHFIYFNMISLVFRYLKWLPRYSKFKLGTPFGWDDRRVFWYNVPGCDTCDIHLCIFDNLLNSETFLSSHLKIINVYLPVIHTGRQF